MGVVDALLADRPEHQARKPAVAARSDDQEIVRGRSLDENVGGRPLDDPAFDFDAFGFVFDVSESPVEQAFGRPLEVIEVNSGVGTD
jgi:hypothetical protein